jgi:uncharacterized protein (TIGR01244 family)
MPEPPSLEGIVRWHPVHAHLATAGQPTEAQLAAVATAGFEVVINLALHDDPRHALADEPGTVAALGLRYVHIPVPFAAPTPAHLAAFSAAMADAAGRRIFVHCAHNKRVPVFVALDRIRRQDWDAEVALHAMRQVWQPDATWQAFIDAQLAR